MKSLVIPSLITLLIVTSVNSQELSSENSKVNGERLTIEVLSSNNFVYDLRAQSYPFPTPPTDKQMIELSNFVEQDVPSNQSSEIDYLHRALLYVCTRWKNNPSNGVKASVSSADILRRASKGERFSSVESSRVLSDLLISHGYPARIVGLSGRGMDSELDDIRHVGVEVWSNEFAKWVFLDPSWGMHPSERENWMSAYEMMASINSGRIMSVDFNPTNEASVWFGNSIDSLRNRYRTFISSHTMYLDVPYIHNKRPSVLMLLCKEGLAQPLLFHGVPTSGMVFTDLPNKLYRRLNALYVEFQYNYSKNSPSNPLYKPEYMLNLSSSMPWLKNYEAMIDSETWQPITGDQLKWAPHFGVNNISFRSTNSANRKSFVTTMSIYYGPMKDRPINPVAGSR